MAPSKSKKRVEDSIEKVTPKSPVATPEGTLSNASKPESTFHIEITQPVKMAAEKAMAAMAELDFDDLGELGIHSVCLRYTEPGAAESLGVLLDTKANGRELSLPLERYIPPDFAEHLIDAAETELSSFPVPPETCGKMRAFVDAFSSGSVLRIELNAHPEAPPDRVDQAKKRVWDAHKTLLAVVGLMRDLVRKDALHEVRIAPPTNSVRGLFFVVDGKPLDLKSREQRVLCVLALLMPSQPFSCRDFSKLYNGTDSDAHRDFFTVMRALKRLLPRLGWKSADSKRSVQGLRVVSEVKKDELEQLLIDFIEAKKYARHRK